jgi:homoserine dehydrogenase
MVTAAADTLEGAVRPAPALSTGTIDIALLGLGRVGSAVARAVLDTPSSGSARLRITGALIRYPERRRDVRLPASCLLTDAAEIFARRPRVVVEVLGGIEPARTLVRQALESGIPVVTANKSLVAAHGDELRRIAARSGAPFLCEATVIAGVPFLGTLSRRPRAAAVTCIRGIVNGTSNYLLTQMTATRTLAAALAEAARLGLSEPDPRNDVLGVDAAEKLSVLLQHLGWGRVAPHALDVRGIDGVQASDIDAARDLGGVIKPVILAERSVDAVTAFVGPAFVPLTDRLASVDGSENALALRNGYGELFYSGPGAGPQATAATVLDDVFEAATADGGRLESRSDAPRLSAIEPGAPVTAWFVRLTAAEKLPPAADIADLLGSFGIWLQRSSSLPATRQDACGFLTLPVERARLDSAIGALTAAARCHASVYRALEG